MVEVELSKDLGAAKAAAAAPVRHEGPTRELRTGSCQMTIGTRYNFTKQESSKTPTAARLCVPSCCCRPHVRIGASKLTSVGRVSGQICGTINTRTSQSRKGLATGNSSQTNNGRDCIRSCALQMECKRKIGRERETCVAQHAHKNENQHFPVTHLIFIDSANPTHAPVIQLLQLLLSVRKQQLSASVLT